MDNTRAAYRILAPNGFFGPDDHLYIVGPDGTYPEIYFDGIPNEEMEPLNDLARARLANYLNDLDDKGRLAAEKAGKSYASRPRDLDGAIQIATLVAREDMRIQGVQKTDTPAIGMISEVDAVSDTGMDNPKRGRGRPSKASLLIRDNA